jgi:hypothetical protein
MLQCRPNAAAWVTLANGLSALAGASWGLLAELMLNVELERDQPPRSARFSPAELQ